VTAALIGGAALTLAGVFTAVAALVASRGPAHLADVTGLSALLDQVQEERDRALAQLAECQAEARRLRGETHG
jgi:hypothetical protein